MCLKSDYRICPPVLSKFGYPLEQTAECLMGQFVWILYENTTLDFIINFSYLTCGMKNEVSIHFRCYNHVLTF